MDKFLKATLNAKKSHPDSPESIVVYSDKFTTAKALSEAAIAELAEAGEDVSLWFAPKVDRITFEEYQESLKTECVENQENNEQEESEMIEKSICEIFENNGAGFADDKIKSEVVSKVIAVLKEMVFSFDRLNVKATLENLADFDFDAEFILSDFINLRTLRENIRECVVQFSAEDIETEKPETDGNEKQCQPEELLVLKILETNKKENSLNNDQLSEAIDKVGRVFEECHDDIEGFDADATIANIINFDFSSNRLTSDIALMLLNIRRLRELFRVNASTGDKSLLSSEAQEKQEGDLYEAGAIADKPESIVITDVNYHYFEYKNSLPFIIKTSNHSGMGFDAGFAFLPIHKDSEFSKLEWLKKSEENAALFCIGTVVDHLVKLQKESDVSVAIKCQATLDGIHSKSESWLSDSKLSDKEVNLILEPQESINFDAWDQNEEIEYKDIYSAIVDVICTYDGEKMPSAKECYENLISLSEEGFDELALIADIKKTKNPNVFTNSATSMQMMMGVNPKAESSLTDDKNESIEKINKENKIDRMVFNVSGDCKFFIELSGDKFHIANIHAYVLGGEIHNMATMTSKEEALIYAINCVKGSLSGHIDPSLLDKIISNAKKNPIEWFDLNTDNSIPCRSTRAKNTSDTGIINKNLKSEPEAEPDLKSEPESVPEKSEFTKQVESFNEKINALELGELIIFDDMPNEIYHACDGISSSQIKDGMISMMYFDAKYNKKEIEQPSGSHFDVGNVFHSIVLEPEVTKREYIQEPSGGNVPKKPTEPQMKKYNEWVRLGEPSKKEAPKAHPTELMFDRCRFWNYFYENNKGQYPVAAEDWEVAEEMAKSALSDSDSGRLLSHPQRACERSYFKRCIDTGLIIKARPDFELGRIIADLKSISLRGKFDEEYILQALRKEVLNRRYDLSAAMYLDICGKDQFIWIFTNKEKGYHWTATIQASEETLNRGFDLYNKYKNKIADSYNSGKWGKPESLKSRINEESGKLELPQI